MSTSCSSADSAEASSEKQKVAPVSVSSLPKRKRTRVFLELTIAGEDIGRIVIELFEDMAPKTCLNFKCLCSGERGVGSDGTVLHYAGSRFHRVVKGFMIQGGDIGDATANVCIYGTHFDDECFALKHDAPGLVAMANRGPHTNGCQFYITTAAAPHLDATNVVFGRVVSGMKAVRAIENTPVNLRHRPRFTVAIKQCGDYAAFLRIKQQLLKQEMHEHSIGGETDELLKDIGAEATEGVASLLFGADVFEKGTGELQHSDTTATAQKPKQAAAVCFEENEEDDFDLFGDKALSSGSAATAATSSLRSEEVSSVGSAMAAVSSNPFLAKLRELKMKRKEASALNRGAVMDELKALSKATDGGSKKSRKRKRKQLDEDKYLHESALYAKDKSSKRMRKPAAFGWDVFNQDTLYAAYDKRCKRLRQDAAISQTTSLLSTGGKGLLHYAQPLADDPLRVEGMCKELRKTAERRSQFQRRRTHYEDADVTHINHRNEVFNKKVERAFGEYAARIKGNFERGTAL